MIGRSQVPKKVQGLNQGDGENCIIKINMHVFLEEYLFLICSGLL